MLLKELIEKLQGFDPNLEVLFLDEDRETIHASFEVDPNENLLIIDLDFGIPMF